MTIKKNEKEELFGLVLKENEKKRLYEICIKYNIKILYPNLFISDKHYSLWALNKNAIGLIGTFLMRKIKEKNGIIFTSLDELEKHMNSLYND